MKLFHVWTMSPVLASYLLMVTLSAVVSPARFA
jgi:hypothetical protein